MLGGFLKFKQLTFIFYIANVLCLRNKRYGLTSSKKDVKLPENS